MPLLVPSVSHKFIVTFFCNDIVPGQPKPDDDKITSFFKKNRSRLSKVPYVVDFAFQRITGFDRELEVNQHREGGENRRNQWLPGRVNHGSLLLERGVNYITPLTTHFDRVLRGASTNRLNVLVMLLDEYYVPTTNWFITNALPVRWNVGDLDATSNQVLINSLELRYQDMRVKGYRL